MHRIPIRDVKDVILSRERGPRVWLKWSVVLAFGITSMIVMIIGLWLTPTVKPGLFGTAGPFAFAVVGLIMLIDGRWRLVLTIRTRDKVYRWRPHIFDKRDEVKILQEGFLAACRYVAIPTHRLDLVNEREIATFWKWFQQHASDGEIIISRVEDRLHKLCDRVDIEITSEGLSTAHQMIITANYASDAFPIVEEMVFAAPEIRDFSVTAFMPRQKVCGVYAFSGVEYPLDEIFFIPYTVGFELGVAIYADAESIEDHQELIWSLCKDLLGEYDFVLSVQYMQIKELSEVTDPSLLRHISKLPEVVDDFHCFEID